MKGSLRRAARRPPQTLALSLSLRPDFLDRRVEDHPAMKVALVWIRKIWGAGGEET